jgi:hypothetical protein
MLYGIEILKKTTTDIYKLEQFQKKTLEQFLGLPQQTADPAIYIIEVVNFCMRYRFPIFLRT